MMNPPASRAFGRALLGAPTLMCLTATVLAHPFQVEDMQNLSRVGEVRISPDGQWAVFTVTRSDLAKNRSATNLWRVSTAGGEPEQLTFVDHGSNSTPRWSSDGRYLFFLSSRSRRQAVGLPFVCRRRRCHAGHDLRDRRGRLRPLSRRQYPCDRRQRVSFAHRHGLQREAPQGSHRRSSEGARDDGNSVPTLG